MHREDGSVCEDNVFSVAPGEGQNLLVFLQMNTSRCATTQSICVEPYGQQREATYSKEVLQSGVS